MACWFNADALSEEGHLISINDWSAVQLWGIGMGHAGDNSSLAAGAFGGSSWSVATDPTTLSAGRWYHGAGVFESDDTNRSVFLDGTETTNSATQTPSNVDNLMIGSQAYNSQPRQQFDGKIAEVGIWNVKLTPAEIAALAAGYSPLFVRPQNLVIYVPLINDNGAELINRTSWTTATGSAFAHPRIIYPSSQILQFPPAAAPPAGFEPQWYRNRSAVIGAGMK